MEVLARTNHLRLDEDTSGLIVSITSSRRQTHAQLAHQHGACRLSRCRLPAARGSAPTDLYAMILGVRDKDLGLVTRKA